MIQSNWAIETKSSNTRSETMLCLGNEVIRDVGPRMHSSETAYIYFKNLKSS